MDALDSTGRIAGENPPVGFLDWLRGILARVLGGSASTPASQRSAAPIESEIEEGPFVLAPGGYRIRLPDENADRSAGEVLPTVRDTIAALPPLPHVVLELIKEIQNPASTAGSIAEIAASDPALAAALLRTVNSAAFGLTRKITSVADAVNYLGFAVVRSIVVGLRLEQSFPRGSGTDSIDAQDLWVHCLAVSYVADCLAQRVPDVDRGFASTLGLLHDVGKLAIIAKLGGAQTSKSQNKSAKDSASVESSAESSSTREARSFGVDHAGLGASLANRWGLPADLVRAIRWHHDPEKAFEPGDPPQLRKAVFVVQIANELAKYAYPYTDDMELDAGVNAACQTLSLGDSAAKLMDAKVRAAITRAILFASENSQTTGLQPGRFLRLRSGEEAARLIAGAPQSHRIQIDDEAVQTALTAAGVTFDLQNTRGHSKHDEPASALAISFIAPTTAAGIEKLLAAALSHQQRLPLSAAVRSPAGVLLKSLLPNLIESTGNSTIQLVQSLESDKFSIALRADALSFQKRLGNADTAAGRKMVEIELANILNLDWFRSITITADGSGWLFGGQ